MRHLSMLVHAGASQFMIKSEDFDPISLEATFSLNEFSPKITMPSEEKAEEIPKDDDISSRDNNGANEG